LKQRLRGMGFEAPDLVVIGFGLTMAGIGLWHRDRLPDGSVIHRYLLAALAYAWVLRMATRRGIRPLPMAMLRTVGLCSLIPYMFLEMGDILPFVVDHTYERELAALDRLIFLGVDPLEALERWLHPLAVDAMQFAYVTYYPVFLTGLFILARRPHRTLKEFWTAPTGKELHDFYAFMTAIALTQCGTYLGYLVVPAMSPYRAAMDPQFAGLYHFTKPVWGHYIQPWLGAWVHASETNVLDCFPSGHTAGGLVVLMGMWKWRRPVFYWVLPVQMGLIGATVYLRYHYVVDVLAGALWAVIALRVAIRWSDAFQSVAFPVRAGGREDQAESSGQSDIGNPAGVPGGRDS